MDYMEGIPSPNHGNDCVFLFINQLSKMPILATYKKSIMVESIANLLCDYIWDTYKTIGIG